MNSLFQSQPELESLLEGFLENRLSAADQETLSALLRESAEARALFVQACELHAMLQSEPELRESMSADLMPGNVIALSRGKALTTAGDATERSSRRFAPIAAAILLSLLAIGGLALFPFPGEEESALLASPASNPFDGSGESSPEENGATAANREDRETEALDPKTQYDRAVLASLGSGSQQRPPTNFSVEPSLADSGISYNRHIRPILSDNCFSCHGPDGHGRKADLRLDTFEGATDPELKTIVPGDVDASELVARILSPDQDNIMPPPESHKTLTPAQIDLLKRWIADGAEYEEHWAFLPVTRPGDGSAPVSIDVLVDKSLSAQGLTRSAEAPPEILVRRLFLDLTGLPPSPQELEAFASGKDPDAYTKLVDELLSRPAFGEHRARYWLDAARYADTHGLHLDNYREMWPYRDWVITAFNENKPFDEFTIEQIAGDLLPDATTAQQIATGFNRCNVTTSEGGSIEEEFLVRYAVDRVATTSTVWMGLTAACAQCHDHKFDPITMKDFYSLFAFFNNTTQPGMDGNAKDSPPVIRVYATHDDEERAATLNGQIAAKRKEAETALTGLDPAALTVAGVRPDLAFASSGALERKEAGQFRKTEPFTISFRFDLPESEGRIPLLSRTAPDRGGRGWQVFWEDRGIFIELIEQNPDKRLKTGLTRRIPAGAAGHFAIVYDGSGHSNGIRLYHNGTLINSRFQNTWLDTLSDDFTLADTPLKIGNPEGNTDGGDSASISELFLADRLYNDEEIKLLANLPNLLKIEKTPADKRKKEDATMLREFLLTFSEGPYRDHLIELAALRTELQQIESISPTTLVMAEKTDTMPSAHLLLRGEYDQKADEIPAAFPAFLPVLDESLPRNRLGLAKWLVHPEHPLTARVTVNRIWQELFGVGLVKTAEDFGTQGENPSHPELLDFLAASFVGSGWDVKALYRQIVLSGTYRQSSVIPGDMAKRDPENRLLARGPRFRLDAEVIRDQALHVSGLLDETMGGKSVRPYQPGGIWEAVGYSNSNTQTFFQDYGPTAENRRSIYTFWKRTAHAPNLAIFDAPNRESCIMRRERTNTPLQALVMMNDPQFVRAARYLAKRVIEEADDRDARLDLMATLLRGHAFTAEERQVVVNSFDQFRNIYESDAEAAAKLLIDEANAAFSILPEETPSVPEFAAWTMVANQLLNLDESLNKN